VAPGHRLGSIAAVFIKPITVRILVYGLKANVAAIRTRAVALLKDEFGKADPALLVELSAEDAHSEITTKRWDPEVVLKKPTASQAAIAITLPEVNERATTEWLRELPAAKSCVVFITWLSPRENADFQMLIAEGDRATDSRPATPG
jgi:hypothetical protein